jgi:hypothetical protein
LSHVEGDKCRPDPERCRGPHGEPVTDHELHGLLWASLWTCFAVTMLATKVLPVVVPWAGRKLRRLFGGY